MSYQSLVIQSVDGGLQGRLISAVQKEIFANDTFGNSAFGKVARATPGQAVTVLMWPLCIDTEAAYESALANDEIEDPGTDPSVITDAQILAAVQAHWPPDPTP